MNAKQRAVIDAARAYQRASLHCVRAAALEDIGEPVPRSSNSWWEEAMRTQAELFAALEAIDGAFRYEGAG